MMKNYFMMTFRFLRKNKGFGWLNIVGLATGITCAALIFLWVEDELTYNHYFAKRDVIYRVMENQTNKGTLITSGSTPGSLAEAMKKEIPGIKNSARLSWNSSQLFVYGEKSIKETGLYADPSLLSMLTLEFIHGDGNTALDQVESVIISESLSKAFFGDANPVGKTFKANGGQSYSVDGLYTITGVYKDLPENSTFQFKWISPYEAFENKNTWLKGWGNNLTVTMVELEPSASPAPINKQLKGFLAGKNTGSTTQCFLFSMNDWKLRDHFTNGQQDGGDIKYVKLFLLIAGIVLLLACINFMNLATARSEQRAKEVGVRKVLGAGKGKLVNQFIGESLVMSFIAVVLAVGLIYGVLPAYNSLVGKHLSLDIFNPIHLASLLGIGLLSGIVAGSYPAFYLSSFNPIGVLKGLRIKTSAGAVFIRKGLVVVQFAVSVTFIICTVIIYQQVIHIKERDLGYNKDNLVSMEMQGAMKERYATIRSELLSTGLVENAAISLHSPLKIYSYGSSFEWPGKDPNDKISIHSNNVSPEYLSTMHMKLLSGRDFYSDYKSDSVSVIISNSLAKLMGPAGKIGGILTLDSSRFQIVGIAGDVVYNDMYGSGAPIVFFCGTAATVMTIRYKKGVDMGKALERTEAVMRASNPGYPFEYSFVDEQFDKLFSTETLVGKLAGVFAALAIFISCLGLFSLAAYTAERRTKEIGIRKVLGATTAGLMVSLSTAFLALVAFSCLVAFPVAWWAMNNWLKEYAYRTTIHWWVFGMAGCGALLIAVLTVSFQAVKAAIANPVRSLRAE